jgi:hypothetical protein
MRQLWGFYWVVQLGLRSIENSITIRGYLFGLFLAFHRKKLSKWTKQLASALCFDEATEWYRQTRESRSVGASRGFVYRDRNVFRIRTYRSKLITKECHRWAKSYPHPSPPPRCLSMKKIKAKHWIELMLFELVILPNILFLLGKLVKFMRELVRTLTSDGLIMVLRMESVVCKKHLVVKGRPSRPCGIRTVGSSLHFDADCPSINGLASCLCSPLVLTGLLRITDCGSDFCMAHSSLRVATCCCMWNENKGEMWWLPCDFPSTTRNVRWFNWLVRRLYS